MATRKPRFLFEDEEVKEARESDSDGAGRETSPSIRREALHEVASVIGDSWGRRRHTNASHRGQTGGARDEEHRDHTGVASEGDRGQRPGDEDSRDGAHVRGVKGVRRRLAAASFVGSKALAWVGDRLTSGIRAAYWRLGTFRGDPQFKRVVEQAFLDGRGSAYAPSGKKERMN